jgi:hypothetical protein
MNTSECIIGIVRKQESDQDRDRSPGLVGAHFGARHPRPSEGVWRRRVSGAGRWCSHHPPTHTFCILPPPCWHRVGTVLAPCWHRVLVLRCGWVTDFTNTRCQWQSHKATFVARGAGERQSWAEILWSPGAGRRIWKKSPAITCDFVYRTSKISRAASPAGQLVR